MCEHLALNLQTVIVSRDIIWTVRNLYDAFETRSCRWCKRTLYVTGFKRSRPAQRLLVWLWHTSPVRACKFSSGGGGRIKFKKIKSNRCRGEGESSSLIKVLPSKSWIICFELLHCYQKGRQRPVWGGIRSVCPKTRTGIFQTGGTMGKEWRLTGDGSCGWLWLTAVNLSLDLCWLLFSGVKCWLSGTSLSTPTLLVKIHLPWAANTFKRDAQLWVVFFFFIVLFCIYDTPALHISSVVNLIKFPWWNVR